MRAILFPGQGSQYVGMGSDFYEKFDLVKKIFETVDKTLGFSLSHIILNGPEAKLKLTQNTQPAIMAIGVSIFNVLKNHFDLNLNNAKFFAGHSLGEYTALVCAGSLTLEKATYLLHERGKSMQKAVAPGQGAMIAILGMTIDDVQKEINLLPEKEICEIANDNSNTQVVVSGKKMVIEILNENLNFDKISHNIKEYKIVKEKEKRRRRLEDLERIEKENITLQKQRKAEEELRTKLKEKALKDEIKIEKERIKDIKLFLRQEQALIRKELAEKQRQFLKQLQLEKQIEKFRVREVKELEKLERISLKEKREDYSSLQDRIEKLKAKYRIIRDQKIRERVEALGVKIQEDDDRETLLRKEKEYTIARQKIELSLESFYRSASSLVFQLNKRHITRHMSIFRCIDRRFETGEIFIKWDESNDDDWLLLIYINNNSLDEGIVIEDKSNPEKNLSHEFKSNEIFKASDMMVDALTQLIARTREKK